jgi:predicted RecB family nuclease
METSEPSNPVEVHPLIQRPVPAITREILEAYLNCRYKGDLKMSGQVGMPSDYEVLMKEIRAETLKRAEVKLAARYGGEPLRGVRIDFACLKRGVPLILDGLIQADGVSLQVDGLIRIDEPSRLGDFQYAPVLIHEREKIEPEQRRLLALLGLLIGDVQGKQPSYGFIVRGRSLKMGRIESNVRSRSARRLLDEIRGLSSATSPPRLILNDHCQVCEFRRACEQQAISEDNLSLLRGIGEKTVKDYGRRGVFTITQLAHMFRPRRKSTSPHRVVTRRNHALSALALKEKMIYIFAEPPTLPSGVSVYVDVESNPEEGYVYLIGMVISGQDQERRYSFWADGKDQEEAIFDLFLDELERLGEFSLLCFGVFEKNFLGRMRKRSSRPELIDRALGSLVNVLSIVYTHFYFPTYSNGLKDIARCLGFEWSDPDASALRSIVWRLRWEATADQSLKGRLLEYNLDDCLALRRVTEFLRSCNDMAEDQKPGSADEETRVAWVRHLERLLNQKKWERNNFAEKDFR